MYALAFYLHILTTIIFRTFQGYKKKIIFQVVTLKKVHLRRRDGSHQIFIWQNWQEPNYETKVINFWMFLTFCSEMAKKKYILQWLSLYSTCGISQAAPVRIILECWCINSALCGKQGVKLIDTYSNYPRISKTCHHCRNVLDIN